jgi:hypothetical protein
MVICHIRQVLFSELVPTSIFRIQLNIFKWLHMDKLNCILVFVPLFIFRVEKHLFQIQWLHLKHNFYLSVSTAFKNERVPVYLQWPISEPFSAPFSISLLNTKLIECKHTYPNKDTLERFCIHRYSKVCNTLNEQYIATTKILLNLISD